MVSSSGYSGEQGFTNARHARSWTHEKWHSSAGVQFGGYICIDVPHQLGNVKSWIKNLLNSFPRPRRFPSLSCVFWIYLICPPDVLSEVSRPYHEVDSRVNIYHIAAEPIPAPEFMRSAEALTAL